MKRMTTHYLLGLSLLAAILISVGCGTKKSVQRIETDTIVDLSGRWNDTDSQDVSEAMIKDCLNHPWITRHTTMAEGKRPAVIVGAIRNRSMEHIPIATFINDIERALINSGQVKVVASATERGELRAEKGDQEQFASPETIKEMGVEHGADYMMTGQINTIEDREGGEQITFYQIDLTLTDIETNEKIWPGQHKIKKYIERSRSSF